MSSAPGSEKKGFDPSFEWDEITLARSAERTQRELKAKDNGAWAYLRNSTSTDGRPGWM